jgi:hypothetical protein
LRKYFSIAPDAASPRVLTVVLTFADVVTLMAGVDSTFLIDCNFDFKTFLIRGYILAQTFDSASAAIINLN